jgi:hypothetical protein
MNQVTKKEAYGLPAMDTLRVLAFNRTGRSYLHELREAGVSGRQPLSQRCRCPGGASNTGLHCCTPPSCRKPSVSRCWRRRSAAHTFLETE